MPQHNALHQFSAGLNNSPANDGGSALPITSAGLQGWKEYYENFHFGLTEGVPADAVNGWEITVEGTTPTTAAAVNGLRLDTLATDNTSVLVQYANAALLMGANTKKHYFETSMQLDGGAGGTQADVEWFLGYTSDQSTTNFVAADGLSWAFDDGFGFGHLDTATEIDFIARQSDVEQTIGMSSDTTDATTHRLGMYYDGSIYYAYLDGSLVAQSSMEVYNNDAAMGLSLYVKSGEAVIKTLTSHYVYLAVEL